MKFRKREPTSKAVQKQDDDGLYFKMDDGGTGTKSQSCMLTILFIS